MRSLLCIALVAFGCAEDSEPDNGPDPQPTAEPEPQPTAEPAPQPTAEPAPQPEPEPAPPGVAPERHRAEARVCDNERPPGSFQGDPNGAECGADADCMDGDNGRCTQARYIYCSYDRCFSDDDCTNDMGGGVCGCEGAAFDDSNVCLGGNCKTDVDCGPGGYCSPTFGSCGNYDGVVAYYCRTANDECLDDSDCADFVQGGYDPYCAFDPGRGHWACSDAHCVGK